MFASYELPADLQQKLDNQLAHAQDELKAVVIPWGIEIWPWAVSEPQGNTYKTSVLWCVRIGVDYGFTDKPTLTAALQYAQQQLATLTAPSGQN